MIRDFLNKIGCSGKRFPPRRRSTQEAALPRKLTKLLVSGPAGGTDPVLWTLLLSDTRKRR